MKDLTLGRTFKTLLIYAIPLAIAGLISQSYNLIDLIIAGKFIGDDALSATGATTTLIQFLSSLFWGCGVAISTRVGKLYGERNNDNIIKSVATCLLSIIILMFILSAICIVFSDTILVLLKVDVEIYEQAKSYFVIYMISLFFQAIHYQLTNILQALGDSKYPLLLTLVSGLSNVFLNILFVAVFKLGVEGLAYATLLSCLISLVFGFIKTNKYMVELGGSLHLRIYKKDLKELVRLSIPCVVQQISLYLSGVIVQPMVNSLGKNYSGGYALAMNVNLVYNAIYHGVSRTVLTYSAQSLGAKKYDNFDKGILNGILLQVMFVLPLIVLTFIFPNAIFSIFLQSEDSGVLLQALPYVTLCLPFVFVCAYGNLMHSFFKSVQSTNTVVFTSLCFTIARIIFAFLLPQVELQGIYLSLSLAWVVEAIILLIVYLTNFKNKVKLWKGQA